MKCFNRIAGLAGLATLLFLVAQFSNAAFTCAGR